MFKDEEKILLLNSTRNENVDAVLSGVVSVFEGAFAGRVRGYYVDGSLADGSGVTTSDVDLMVVFKGGFAGDEELGRVDEVVRQCVASCAVELDLDVVDEQELLKGAGPAFKMGSLLVYGEDVREQVPLWPLEVWTRDRMHSSLWRTVHLWGRSTVVRYPLDYPDPTGEFYGYDRRKLRLADGWEENCTRDLIRLVGWSATGILAFKAGRYVARKRDCHKLYRECFDDEWASLLQELYEVCRGKWKYLIPSDQEERQQLRRICERTLKFENHFLLIYKEFLLSELRSGDTAGKLQALWVLKRITYDDREVEEAIRGLRYDEGEDVRGAAKEIC